MMALFELSQDRPSETPLDQDSARTALDELFTLAGKYNSSDAYLELMRFVGRFRFYSPFNAMLIYTQMPGARFVCTARRWRKKYRREIKISARPIVVVDEREPGCLARPEEGLVDLAVVESEIAIDRDRAGIAVPRLTPEIDVGLHSREVREDVVE